MSSVRAPMDAGTGGATRAPASPSVRTALDALDRAILDRLQEGIPVVERPFAQVASELGTDEDTIIERLRRALDAGVLSRFGPMIDVERMGGAFALCALEVPEARFEAVANTVNAHPEVAHNYAREHALNMWFVLASEDPARIGIITAEIEAETGLEVCPMPKLDEYYVGLRVEV